MNNRSIKALSPAVLLLASMSSALSADDHEETHRQHDAHEHGHATLNLVQEGNTVQLLLESPAANILGFEHSPTNEEEQQSLDKAVSVLKQGEKMFTFPAMAKCEQKEVSLESELTEHETHHEGESHHEGEEESHHDEAEGHSEFEVTYQFSCATPAELNTIKVMVFEHFPLTDEIDAQIVTDKRQFSAELSSEASTIQL